MFKLLFVRISFLHGQHWGSDSARKRRRSSAV